MQVPWRLQFRAPCRVGRWYTRGALPQ